MSRSDQRKSLQTGRKAWKACGTHFGELIFILAVHLIVRLLVLAPLFTFGMVKGNRAADWAGVVLAALIYGALVIPLRFWSGEKMRRLFFSRNQPPRGRIIPYKKWLVTGLLRFGRGLLWGVPFLACAGYLVIGYNTLPFNVMWKPVQALAVLIGQEPNLKAGFPIAAVLLLVLAALFAYGWWREEAAEYLPARSLKPIQTIHWARKIRKEHQSLLIRNTLVNVLLTLPALLGFGAVLVPYVMKNVDFSLSDQMIVTQAARLLKTGMPRQTVVLLLLIFALVYLPLLMVRKMRIASLVGQLMKGHKHHEHHEAQNPDAIG